MSVSSRAPWATLVLPLAAGTLLYGWFVYGFLPKGVIAFNDDFAYLRSVLETVQRGRVWTDDFLEPWSMSLSALSAGLFSLTGSFTLATLGLQLFLPLVSFACLAWSIGNPGRVSVRALLLATAVLTFPTLLWKQAEYTAMILYIPCLIVALGASLRGRWGLFLAAYAVAVASRQSAVLWLVLPAAVALEAAFRRHAWRHALGLLGGVGLGVGWFFALSRWANVTHAQRLITQHAFESLQWPDVGRKAVLVGWLLAIALGGLSGLLSCGHDRRPVSRRWRAIGAGIGILLLATIPAVSRAVPLACEHPVFDNAWALTYFRLLVGLGGLGWIIAPPVLPVAYLAGVFCSGLLVCLRAEVWDYYLYDAVMIGLFGLLASVGSAVEAPRRRLGSILACVALTAIVATQVTAAFPLKRSLDERAGACRVLERALRAGWMQPTDLSHAPFGFVGWNLFPYYVAHEGARSDNLAGFGVYVARHAVEVRVEALPSHRAPADLTEGGAKAFAEILPHGWGRRELFWLERRSDREPPPVAVQTSEYRRPVFPLNDAEWKALLQKPNPP